MTALESWTAIVAFVSLVVGGLWLHHDYTSWSRQRESRKAWARALRPEQSNVRIFDQGGRRG